MVRVPVELEADHVLRADIDINVKKGDRLVIQNSNIVGVIRHQSPFPQNVDLNDSPLTVQTKKGAIQKRIQQLIKEGKDNKEIWDIIQPEFRMTPEKKSYISGQRKILERDKQTELFPSGKTNIPQDKKIIKLLEKKGPLTARQINKVLNFPYGRLSPVLQNLVKYNILEPVNTKVRFPEYRVVAV